MINVPTNISDTNAKHDIPTIVDALIGYDRKENRRLNNCLRLLGDNTNCRCCDTTAAGFVGTVLMESPGCGIGCGLRCVEEGWGGDKYFVL